jgi:hypothetical protein
MNHQLHILKRKIKSRSAFRIELKLMNMGQRKGLLLSILYAKQFSDVLYHLQFYRLKQQLNDS